LRRDRFLLQGSAVVNEVDETEIIRRKIDHYRRQLHIETDPIVRVAIQSMLNEFEAKLRLASIRVPQKRPSDSAKAIDLDQSADPAIDQF
jgi:hypothetical protein